eukprot:m.78376 g.78376  ORF g.78376 m.78376 type:complete len:110 (-) comp50567_c0_seq1:197-526(-)
MLLLLSKSSLGLSLNGPYSCEKFVFHLSAPRSLRIKEGSANERTELWLRRRQVAEKDAERHLLQPSEAQIEAARIGQPALVKLDRARLAPSAKLSSTHSVRDPFAASFC